MLHHTDGNEQIRSAQFIRLLCTQYIASIVNYVVCGIYHSSAFLNCHFPCSFIYCYGAVRIEATTTPAPTAMETCGQSKLVLSHVQHCASSLVKPSLSRPNLHFSLFFIPASLSLRLFTYTHPGPLLESISS